MIRHAKSSWDDPLLDDFSRPLNERGKRDAPSMGQFLKKKGAKPDLILTSTARRTLETAKQIAEEVGYHKEKIKGNAELYHASPKKIVSILNGVKDKHSSIMLIGHNPGLTEFVNELMNQQIANMPTCGVAACTLEVDAWQDAKWKMGKLLFYEFPKSLKKPD